MGFANKFLIIKCIHIGKKVRINATHIPVRMAEKVHELMFVCLYVNE